MTKQITQEHKANLAVFTDEIGLAVLGIDGYFVDVDASFCRIHGWPREHLIGRHVSCLCEPLPCRDANRDYVDFLKTPEPSSRIWTLVEPSGEPRRVLAKAMHIAGADNSPQTFVSVTALGDVADHRPTEDDGYRRIQFILDAVEDAAIGIDDAGVVHMVNAATERLFGYRAQEIIGQHVRLLLPEHPRAGRDYVDLQGRPADRARVIGVGRTLRAIRRDGTGFQVRLRVAEMPVSDSRFFIGILSRDMTSSVGKIRLEQTDTRMLDVIESLAEGFALFDRRGRLVLANAQFRDFLPRIAEHIVPGATYPQIIRIGTECGQFLISGGDSQSWLDTHLALIETGIRASVRFEIETAEGGRFESSISPTSDGGFVVIYNEVTRRREAEEERDRLFELSMDMMAITDFGGYFKRVNPAVEAVLGYRPDELASARMLDFVHPDDQPATLRQLQALARGLPVIEFENRYQSRDGSYRWLQWNAKAHGGRVYSVGRDVTGRRMREERSRERQQQLSEAQRIARLGNWRWIVGTKLVTWSDELYRIFGEKQDEFDPQFNAILAHVHHEDRRRLQQVLGRAIATRGTHELEFRIMRCDGEERILWAEGQCELGPDGTVLAVFGVCQDVTEERLNERALIQAKEAAEAANRSKSDFLASMSHELRTPLNAIMGFSEVMREEMLGPLGNERYRTYASDIFESGGHLLALINDILDLSKIEAGRMVIHNERIVVNDAVAEAVRLMVRPAADKGSRIDVVSDGTLPILVADRRSIRQMLLNLLSNAIKFTPAGGLITVRTGRDRCGLHLSVSDTGIGIPPSRITELARPFVQVDNVFTRRHEGTGIGLYITKSLIELQGGRLRINSRLGEGTTVTLTFPQERLRDKGE